MTSELRMGFIDALMQHRLDNWTDDDIMDALVSAEALAKMSEYRFNETLRALFHDQAEGSPPINYNQKY